MKMKARESLDAYYREAGSWGQDQQEGLRASRRIAWIVAGVASTVALFTAIALLFLTPLKTVEPYTLLVDRQTGYVQALKPLSVDRIAGDTALTQSFLVQYVIARESFDIDSLQSNYRKVALWSTGTARAQYLAAMPASNPESPLFRFPRTTVVETRIKSVSPVGKDVAMVRFETQRREAGGRMLPLRHWVAIVRYRYSAEPLSMEDRLVNPLGFEVVRYRRNIEIMPPDEPRPDPRPDYPPIGPRATVVPLVPITPAPLPTPPKPEVEL